jgi:hypothetical protein
MTTLYNTLILGRTTETSKFNIVPSHVLPGHYNHMGYTKSTGYAGETYLCSVGASRTILTYLSPLSDD